MDLNKNLRMNLKTTAVYQKILALRTSSVSASATLALHDFYFVVDFFNSILWLLYFVTNILGGRGLSSSQTSNCVCNCSLPDPAYFPLHTSIWDGWKWPASEDSTTWKRFCPHWATPRLTSKTHAVALLNACCMSSKLGLITYKIENQKSFFITCIIWCT